MSKSHRRMIFDRVQENITHRGWIAAMDAQDEIDRMLFGDDFVDRQNGFYADDYGEQEDADLYDDHDDEDDHPPDHPDRIAEEEYQRNQRLA